MWLKRLMASFRRQLLAVLTEIPAADRLRVQRYARSLAKSSEPELRLIQSMARDRTFVDVGANIGIYSVHALDHGASSVVALEPIPVLARRLEHRLGAKGRVLEVAASSRSSYQRLLVPEGDQGVQFTRASLAKRGEKDVGILVRTEPLDEIDLSGDALVKIDVEGHELEVLEGARRVLASGAVHALLVESEARHNPAGPERVCEVLESLGFRGWIAFPGKLVPARLFKEADHQRSCDVDIVQAGGRRPPTYGNNFWFVKECWSEFFLGKIREIGYEVTG